MRRFVKSFDNFLNEYWISDAPGSVVVPGEWYKDNVNSKNYRSVNTNMPVVVDSMFEDIDSLKEDQEFMEKIKGSTDPLEIIDLFKEKLKLKRKK